MQQECATRSTHHMNCQRRRVLAETLLMRHQLHLLSWRSRDLGATEKRNVRPVLETKIQMRMIPTHQIGCQSMKPLSKQPGYCFDATSSFASSGIVLRPWEFLSYEFYSGHTPIVSYSSSVESSLLCWVSVENLSQTRQHLGKGMKEGNIWDLRRH